MVEQWWRSALLDWPNFEEVQNWKEGTDEKEGRNSGKAELQSQNSDNEKEISMISIKYW